MNRKDTKPDPVNLEIVRSRFESWRKNRKKRTPIPNELWQAAVDLANDFSIYAIARSLRLNYSDLKHRVESVQGRSVLSSQPAAPGGFVEIDLKGHTYLAECTVEIEKPDGERMRMSFKGDVNLDLLALSSMFLGTGK